MSDVQDKTHELFTRAALATTISATPITSRSCRAMRELAHAA